MFVVFLRNIFSISMIFFFFFISSVFAQVVEDSPQEVWVAPVCIPYIITVEGENIVLPDVTHEYTWVSDEALMQDASLVQRYTLYDGDTILNETDVPSVAYTFTWAWDYRVLIEVSTAENCTYTWSLSMTYYDRLYTYLGPVSQDFDFAREASWWSGTYFHHIDTDMFGGQTTQFSDAIAANAYYIDHADNLFIDGDLLSNFFGALQPLQQLTNFSLVGTDVFVLAQINQSALRRIVATHSESIEVDEVRVLEKEYMGSLLPPLLMDKDIDTLSFVKKYTIWLNSSNRLLWVSYVVDYLLYNWFPTNTLVFVLMIPVLVLLISVFRQIIWLSVFSVFYPMLFAFCLYVVWVPLTLLLLVAGFVTTLVVWHFTKYIYLLYSPKASLLATVYCLVALWLLWWFHSLYPWIIDFSVFQNPFFLFVLIIMLMIGNRLFTENVYLFNTWRWIGLLEFVVVSLSMFFLLQNTWLQNIVLWYPEISLLCGLLIVLVWRFTWLQIMEYIKFLPLLRSYFGEEE